jgi:hypothetical protein
MLEFAWGGSGEMVGGGGGGQMDRLFQFSWLMFHRGFHFKSELFVVQCDCRSGWSSFEIEYARPFCITGAS